MYAGAVAVIVVLLRTVTLVAAVEPKLTPVAPVKFVPVIVTWLPPAAGPEVGETAVTLGPFTNTHVPPMPSPFAGPPSTAVLPSPDRPTA